MKKTISLLITAILVLVTATCLPACGETPEQRLKTYIDSSEFNEQIEPITESLKSILDIDIKADGKNLVFDFSYKTQIPDDALDEVRKQLNTSFEGLSNTYAELVSKIEKSTGIDNMTIQVNINRNDGKNLVSYIYDSDGIRKNQPSPTGADNIIPTVTETTAVTSETSNPDSEKADSGTTADKPAPRGNFVLYTVRNYSTDSLFNATARITNVTTDTDDKEYVDKAIENYNTKKSILKIDRNKLNSAYCEYVVADIEIKIPNGESVMGFTGNIEPLSYSIEKPSGVSYQTEDGDSIIFTTSVAQLNDDVSVSAGDTVKTQVIYAMVKGFKQYSLQLTSHSLDDNFSTAFLSAY